MRKIRKEKDFYKYCWCSGIIHKQITSLLPIFPMTNHSRKSRYCFCHAAPQIWGRPMFLCKLSLYFSLLGYKENHWYTVFWNACHSCHFVLKKLKASFWKLFLVLFNGPHVINFQRFPYSYVGLGNSFMAILQKIKYRRQQQPTAFKVSKC